MNTEKDLQNEAKNDNMLKMAKAQGYVPEGCYLDGQLVMLLVNGGKDPCKGCNCDRKLCNGRPH